MDAPIEFRAVWPYNDGRPIVVAEYEPHDASTHLDEWFWLRHLWLDLPPHPNLVDAITRRPGTTLLVRYAAVHPKPPQVTLERFAARRLVATWAVELARVFDLVARHVGSAQLGHFLRPVVYIDLVNRSRVGFLPASASDEQLPDEARATWPECEPRAASHVIGKRILDLAVGWDVDADAKRLRELVERCVHRDPTQRFELADIMMAFGDHAATPLRGDKLDHADCLAFEHRHDDAISMYDRAAELSADARVKAVRGAITSLLALDRVAEVFTRLDAATELAGDAELLEARAIALARMHLDDDAEHAHRCVVAISHGQSDRRLGRRL